MASMPLFLSLPALLPVISLPTALSFRAYLNITPSQRVERAKLIRTYAAALLLGLPLAGLGQAVLGYSFFYLFHGRNTSAYLQDALSNTDNVSMDVRTARAALAWSWQQIVKRAWLAYVVTGGWEEILKALPLFYVTRRDTQGNGDDLQDKKQEQVNERRQESGSRALVQYAVATGLGFSAMESVVGACGLLLNTKTTATRLAVELGERIWQGTLGHVLMTTLAALRLSRRRQTAGRSSPATVASINGSPEQHAQTAMVQKQANTGGMALWRVVLPSILYHGTFNFTLLSISAMNGHLNWVHPWDTANLTIVYGFAISFLALLARQVRTEWVAVNTTDKKYQ